MNPSQFDLSDPDAMFYCPSCGGGFTSRALRCRNCDVDLVPRSHIESLADQARLPHVPSTSLCTLEDPVKIAILESQLEEAGIEYVKRDHVGISEFSEFAANRSEFVVLESELALAQSLLKEIEGQEEAEEPDEG